MNYLKNQDLIIILLTLMIIGFLFYIIIVEKNYIDDEIMEHYDLEIPNISSTECGTQCTEGLNCAGFGYKPIEKTCYLSKTAILGEPMESLYSDRYSKLDKRCNKINRITDVKRVDGNSLTENSIYVCADGENNTAVEFQYANQGASSLEGAKTTIYDTADKDKLIPENVKYPVHEITWPKTKLESNTIASIPYTNLLSSGDSKKQYGFVESDKEFLGQYLLAHQCVVNVPFFDCLKYCENNPNCAGTEWNKSLVKESDKNDYNYLYENVCCPKSVIKQIIPRRKEMDRGRFYVKKDLAELVKREKIVLTKADLTSAPPINNRFSLKFSNFDKPDPDDPSQQNTSLSSVPGITEPIYDYR